MILLQQHQSLFVLLKRILTNLENIDKFKENTNKNLPTNDKYKDEVTIEDLNSLSKNTTQDNHLMKKIF